MIIRRSGTRPSPGNFSGRPPAGVAEATLARTYASVWHFARWPHFKMHAFPMGCPTDGVRPPREPEPSGRDCRALLSFGS
jgi:hypothetical protein